MLPGCIADDCTGATDLANVLVRAGMRTVQTIGVPEAAGVDGDPDVVVVAIKTRTAPAADAIAEREATARLWLLVHREHLRPLAPEQRLPILRHHSR